MKQKLVFKFGVSNKSGSMNAMMAAVSFKGVESAAVREEDMRQIEVIGKGIDAIQLIALMEKEAASIGELLTVSNVDVDGGEKNEENKRAGIQREAKVTLSQNQSRSPYVCRISMV
ncbi:hypothetical protein WN944_011170 [Citrus x changshan-huyou]|uniref:Uncharacterized protein n=1 Tax=Citrus x changshan-huyou TaxID=2935761 RepID=A0AAP0R194_9ROSI